MAGMPSGEQGIDIRKKEVLHKFQSWVECINSKTQLPVQDRSMNM
jgi:hypothetical protein